LNVLLFVVEEDLDSYNFILDLVDKKVKEWYISQDYMHILLEMPISVIKQKHKEKLVKIFFDYYVWLNISLDKQLIKKLWNLDNVIDYEILEKKLEILRWDIEHNNIGLGNIFLLIQVLINNKKISKSQITKFTKTLKNYLEEKNLRSFVRITLIQILWDLWQLDTIKKIYDKDLFTTKWVLNTYTSSWEEKDDWYCDAFINSSSKIEPEWKFSIQVYIDVISHSSWLARVARKCIYNLRTKKWLTIFLEQVKHNKNFRDWFLSLREVDDLKNLLDDLKAHFTYFESKFIECLITIYWWLDHEYNFSKSNVVQWIVGLFEWRSDKLAEEIFKKIEENVFYTDLEILLAEITDANTLLQFYQKIKQTKFYSQKRYLWEIYYIHNELYNSLVIPSKLIDESDKVNIIDKEIVDDTETKDSYDDYSDSQETTINNTEESWPSNNDLKLKKKLTEDEIIQKIDYIQSLKTTTSKRFSAVWHTYNVIESDNDLSHAQELLWLSYEWRNLMTDFLKRSLEFDLKHNFEYDVYVSYLYNICFTYFDSIAEAIEIDVLKSIENLIRSYNEKWSLHWSIYDRIEKLKKNRYNFSSENYTNSIQNTVIHKVTRLVFAKSIELTIEWNNIVSFSFLKDNNACFTVTPLNYTEMKANFDKYYEGYKKDYRTKQYVNFWVVFRTLFFFLDQNKDKLDAEVHSLNAILDPIKIIPYWRKTKSFSNSNKKPPKSIKGNIAQVNMFLTVLYDQWLIWKQIKISRSKQDMVHTIQVV